MHRNLTAEKHIMDFSQFLSAHGDLIASIITIGLIAWYTVLTHRMLRNTNKPHIVVRLGINDTHSDSLINIVVENIGTGPAKDIKITPSCSNTEKLFDLPLEKIGFIKHGIEYLANGQAKESFLTSIIGKFEKQKKTPISVKVTYNDSTGKGYPPEIFTLDFYEFEWVGTVGLKTTAGHLHTISETLSKSLKQVNAISEIRNELKTLNNASTITVEKFNGEGISVHSSEKNNFMLVQFRSNEEEGWAIGHTTSPIIRAETLVWRLNQVTALKDKKSAEIDYKNLERIFHKGGGFISFYDEIEAQNSPCGLIQERPEEISTTVRLS